MAKSAVNRIRDQLAATTLGVGALAFVAPVVFVVVIGAVLFLLVMEMTS